MMNRISKRTAGILLAALIGLSFLFWRDPTPQQRTDAPIEQVVKSDQDNPIRRRKRAGPRTPPAVSPVPNEIPEKEPQQEDSQEQEPTEQERKLEAYLEHLEAIPDPNVDELTMLGEMAFDANQAEAAYEHYLEVIEEHTDNPMAPFALYKLAWAEYNLGDVEAAIDDMELMMEWVAESETQLHETLRSEGTKDLDLFDTKAN